MQNSELASKLKEMDARLVALDHAARLALLDDLIRQESSPTVIFHMLVKKAIELSYLGNNIREAIALFEDCSNRAEADEGAAYYAAELHAVEHRYQDAVRCLEVAERQMVARGSSYWASCIHLLHAYCAAKLGNFTDAKRFLDQSVSEDDELTLFWVKTRPIISAQVVEGLIAEGQAA